MKRMLFPVAFCLVFIITLATHVLAEPPIEYLKGTYTLTGTRECVYGSPGAVFGAGPTYPLPSNPSLRIGHTEGKLIINLNGTGTWESRLMQIRENRISSGSPSWLTGWESTCEVEFDFDAAGGLELRLPYCEGPLTEGFFTGNIAFDRDTILSVAVSVNGDILLLSDTQPNIETVWGGPGAPDQERICSRSITAVRIK
jgi:hypothetical protein